MSFTLPAIPEEYLELKFIDKQFHQIKKNVHEGILPFSASKVFLAPVKCAKFLTKTEDVKSVVVVCLCLKDIKFNFEPGQTFGIIPRNNINEVNKIIERLNLTDDANKTYQLSIKTNCNKKNAKLPNHVPIIGTIYNTLISNLDIRSVPRKLFLRALSKYTTNENEKYLLDEMCSTENTEKYSDFIANNYVTLLELLKQFKSCMPPFSLLLEHLPKLQPRPYSIACVPNLQNELKFIFSVERLPNNYIGVCTGQLVEMLAPILDGANVEVKIPIYLRQLNNFKLPDSISTNIIMIATGTGIAPILSFLEQRKFDLENNEHIGNIFLYYGCRYSNKDYLFKDEIEDYLQIGVIKKLYTSFSRENRQIKYVQDNIKENEKEFILQFKNNCNTLVCGNARMCRDVFETIINCYGDVECLTYEEASIIVNDYKKVKRYIEDIWT